MYSYTRSEPAIQDDKEACIQRSCVCLLMERSVKNAKTVRSAIENAKASGVAVREEECVLLLTASIKSACLREAVENISGAANLQVVKMDAAECRTMLQYTFAFDSLVEVMDDCIYPERRAHQNMAPTLNTEDLDD